MNEDNVTAPNAVDRFRRAQSLVVEHLDLSPQEADATKRFGLWKRKLEIYLLALEVTEEEKFNILINRLGLNSYENVDVTTTYTEAVKKLAPCKKVIGYPRVPHQQVTISDVL